MLDGTMTPPRDGGLPESDELVARVIPLRRRSEVADSMLTASPLASASGGRDAADGQAPAFPHGDMWEDRASQLPVREPATGGLRSPGDVAAPRADRSRRRRHVSLTRLGIAALAAGLVAAGAVALASSGPHVATRAAHVRHSTSAPAAAKVSPAKTVAARAAASKAALRAARKRAAAAAARERAARATRAHELALSRARRAARARAIALASSRATRARKQRAQTRAHEQDSNATSTPTAQANTPALAVTEPAVTGPPTTSAHLPQTPAPKVAPARGGAASSCVPGELGC